MAMKTFCTKGPICPNCSHKHIADEAYYYDEGLTEMTCEACNQDFNVSVYVSTSWTCTPREQGRGDG